MFGNVVGEEMAPALGRGFLPPIEAEGRAWIQKLKRGNTYTTHDWANRYSDMQHSTRDKFLEWESVMIEAHPDMVLHGLRVICKHEPTCY